MTNRTTQFAQQFDPLTPGLILFLLDQSGSMHSKVGELSKSEIAADAINQTIEDLVERCRRGPVVLEKADIGVIGYGDGIRYELADSVVALDYSFKDVKHKTLATTSADHPVIVEQKIWITPRAENGTPMAEALELAAKKLRDWTREYPNGPRPVVLNVTDGSPNDLSIDKGARTRRAAELIRTLGQSEDHCLLFCVHIGADPCASPLIFPSSIDELVGPSQCLLFNIASEVPPDLVNLGRAKGLPVRKGSRLVSVNAAPADLLRILDFGSSTIDASQMTQSPSAGE